MGTVWREDRRALESLPKSARDGIWIALVTGSSILFSLALACATPFAAIATIAGTRMDRRAGMLLIGAAWLANQAVGYLILGYPQTWDSFAWGGVMGIAALLAAVAACEIARRGVGPFVSLAVGFLAAFAVYELALLAAAAALPSGDGAFTLEIIARIFGLNVLALGGLLLLYRAAIAVGLLAARPPELSGAHL